MSSNPYDESSSVSPPDRSSGDAESRAPSGAKAQPGRPRGHSAWSGATQRDGLGTFLGWFSVGLGALELCAPRTVARAIGVEPTPKWNGLLQLYGVREIATGAGILRNPRSKEWVGMRIGGDVLDLMTLGVAITQARQPGRAWLASAVVMGATMLDILGSERLAEKRKAPTVARAVAPHPYVLRSITVGRMVDEVFSFWKDFANFPRFMQHVESVEILGGGRSRWRATGPAGTRAEWTAEVVEQRENELIAWRSVDASELYNAGRVSFRPAPRDSGTVVTVEMEYAPPGGRIGAALLKLFRKEPGQQVIDDLRRFKQVMETGEVLYSDASAQSGIASARPPEGAQSLATH